MGFVISTDDAAALLYFFYPSVSLKGVLHISLKCKR